MASTAYAESVQSIRQAMSGHGRSEEFTVELETKNCISR